MTKIGDCPYFIDRIEDARGAALIGRKVVLFKSTASTNDIAWEYAANNTHHGLCVLAESQRKGRGRRGRFWYSNPGESILASILLLDQPMEAELLTLTTAVATAEAIQAFCKLPCRIKWPNDILANGKKLAGILVEKRIVRKRHHFVIGIGINCNQPSAFFETHDLRIPATSLAIETSQSIDRTQLVCILLEKLEKWLKKSHDYQAITSRWQQLSDLLGRHIIVESDNRQYSGFCRGIDPAEGLVVQLDAGPVRIFNANQTSILRA